MIERLLPPWAIVLVLFIGYAAFGERVVALLVIALVIVHFVLKHNGREGLFGSTFKSNRAKSEPAEIRQDD